MRNVRTRLAYTPELRPRLPQLAIARRRPPLQRPVLPSPAAPHIVFPGPRFVGPVAQCQWRPSSAPPALREPDIK